MVVRRDAETSPGGQDDDVDAHLAALAIEVENII